MLKVYFNPNCATCQTALSLLKKNTDEEMELIEYLVETPTQNEIKEILSMLGMKAEDLVRKKELLYKDKYEGKKISNAEWIKILVKNLILFERPIVVKDSFVFFGW